MHINFMMFWITFSGKGYGMGRYAGCAKEVNEREMEQYKKLEEDGCTREEIDEQRCPECGHLDCTCGQAL